APYRRALAILDKLASDDPNQPLYQEAQVGVMHRLASLYYHSDRGEEAERIALQRLAIVDRLAVNYPALNRFQFQLTDAFLSLGAILCDKLDKPVEAEAVFRKAITLMPGAAACHHNLGIALLRQRRLTEAET